MYPQTHFLLPFVLAEILVKFNILNHKFALLAGLLGMFIDIDHFIEFAIHHKDLSIKHAWDATVKQEIRKRTFIHHKIGFILITLFVIILFFLEKRIFWIALLGYYTHIFLDYIPNIIKIKKVFTIKIIGFTIHLSLFELIFDILLVLSIVGLWYFI